MNRADELLWCFIRSEPSLNLAHKTEFLYYEALIEFRKENYDAAAELVEKIDINKLLDKLTGCNEASWGLIPSQERLQGRV